MPSRSMKDMSSVTITCTILLWLKSQGTLFSEQREIFLQLPEAEEKRML